jgi:hypothetical protein
VEKYRRSRVAAFSLAFQYYERRVLSRQEPAGPPAASTESSQPIRDGREWRLYGTLIEYMGGDSLDPTVSRQ